jgi:outer membrane protein OmpA-like peptidoglycan-associated protein
MHHIKSAFLLGLALLFLSGQAARSDTRIPDTDEMIEILKIKAHKAKSLSRSWSSKGVSVDAGEGKAEDPSRIDLQVNFEYDSAQLSTDAQLILNRLGKALNSTELRSQHFKITGHTDAVGGEIYNLDLSKRRALSVQEYLVQKQHVGGDRLEVDGKGYSQLADPTHPLAAVNRRVQVLNLGS